MDKQIYTTLYWTCNYLSVVGLKLIHVNPPSKKKIYNHKTEMDGVRESLRYTHTHTPTPTPPRCDVESCIRWQWGWGEFLNRCMEILCYNGGGPVRNPTNCLDEIQYQAKWFAYQGALEYVAERLDIAGAFRFSNRTIIIMYHCQGNMCHSSSDKF